MEKKWNEKTKTEKIASIISFGAFCVWLLFEWLENKTSLEFAKYVNYIAICVICVCEAISFWRVKRGLSYFAIAAAVFIIVVMVLEVLLLL